MFQFASEFRQEPAHLSPNNGGGGGGILQQHNKYNIPSVSPTILQQLTSVAQEFDELANTCLLLLHLEVHHKSFYL